MVYIRLHRKSIYLPTAWYLAPERNPDGVSRLLQSKSADLIAKSTQKPGGFRIPPRPPQTSRGTPLHPSGTAYELAQVKTIKNKNGLILFLIVFTQANVPQITRHLAVFKQINFYLQSFMACLAKIKLL